MVDSVTRGGVWQVTLSISVRMSAPTLHLTRCLLIVTDILSRGTVTSRTPCTTCVFIDFSIGVADDSVLLVYDALSLDNQINMFRRKILP